MNSMDRQKEHRVAVLIYFFIYSCEVLVHFIRAKNRFLITEECF